MKDKLNARQKKFAEYYAECGNIVQSAVKAGYSENYANSRAHELLENVGVAEYIKKMSEDEHNTRILTAKERQAILSNIAKSIDNTPTDRIRAIDTLNKMTGEYLNRVEISGRLEKAKTQLDNIAEQLGIGDE